MNKYVDREAKTLIRFCRGYFFLAGAGALTLGFIFAEGWVQQARTVCIVFGAMFLFWVVLISTGVPMLWWSYFNSAGLLIADETGVTRKMPRCFHYHLDWSELTNCGIFSVKFMQGNVDYVFFSQTPFSREFCVEAHAPDEYMLRGAIVFKANKKKKLQALQELSERHGVELVDYRKRPMVY